VDENLYCICWNQKWGSPEDDPNLSI